MNNYGDKDYYKINLSQSSMPFCFTHDTINSSSTYWSIKILKYNSGTYDEVFSKTLYMNDTAGQLTTITSSGTYYVCISTSSYYNTTGCDYNILIGAPDTTKPTGSISSTNKLATSQTVTLTLSDNVGIAGYYWGTSSNYKSNNFYQTSSKSVIDTVSSSGTYYLTVKDTSGNLSSTVSKTFYKTTLNANSGSVTPSYIITMNGNSFTFPTPSKSGSSYNGWSTSSSATSGVKTLTPTSNTTYYAVWKQDQTEVVPTSVTLSKTTLSLNIGKSEILTATVIPSNATNKTINWTSSDSKVATVSNGKVTAVSVGTAKITAKTTNGKYATCQVTVKNNVEPNVPQIIVESKTVAPGATVTLSIQMKNNPGINGWAFDLAYDRNTFELVRCDAGVFGEVTTSNQISQNPYHVQWYHLDDVKTNGETCKMTFNVKQNANEGNYVLRLSYDEEEICNQNEENIYFGVTNGTINVSAHIPGDVNDDGKVNLKDVIRLNQYVAGWNVTVNSASADANGDGKVNLKDVIRLNQYVAGWNVSVQ